MYTVKNYKTKKELKEALARGESVEVFQPNDLFGTPTANRAITIEGPHYPRPHRWYAKARTDDASCIIPGTLR